MCARASARELICIKGRTYSVFFGQIQSYNVGAMTKQKNMRFLLRKVKLKNHHTHHNLWASHEEIETMFIKQNR